MFNTFRLPRYSVCQPLQNRREYHISDLEALQPTSEELTQAAMQVLTHDVSLEFRGLLKQTLERLGDEHVAAAI